MTLFNPALKLTVKSYFSDNEENLNINLILDDFKDDLILLE